LYCTGKFLDEMFYQCVSIILEFVKIGERKLGVMIRDAEVQLTLDNVPIIKSYGESEDYEVSEKIAAKGAEVCVDRIGSVLNRTLTTRT
jgi:predicted metal-dependent phosphotriesterase family hydrolase